MCDKICLIACRTGCSGTCLIALLHLVTTQGDVIRFFTQNARFFQAEEVERKGRDRGERMFKGKGNKWQRTGTKRDTSGREDRERESERK